MSLREALSSAESSFSGLNASCGNLRPRFRLISVLKHQELPSAFDVDHDSLTALHP